VTSVAVAQAILLLWTMIFGIGLLVLLTIAYNHAIYFTDSAPIAVFLTLLAEGYVQTFLPFAMFPIAFYFLICAVVIGLKIGSVISRIVRNFLRAQIDAMRPRVFSETAKTLGAFLTLTAFLFEATIAAHVGDTLPRFERIVQTSTIYTAVHLAAPVTERFVPTKPESYRAYLWLFSFFYQGYGQLATTGKRKLDQDLPAALKSARERWDQHVKPTDLKSPK